MSLQSRTELTTISYVTARMETIVSDDVNLSVMMTAL